MRHVVSRTRHLMIRSRAGGGLVAALLASAVLAPDAGAQQDSGFSTIWPGGFEIRGAIEDLPDVKPDASLNGSGSTEAVQVSGRVALEAVLTSDGEPIDDNIAWRIFTPHTDPAGAPKLVKQELAPRPVLSLPPGTYWVNAAFGKANLTRRIVVLENGNSTEQFVLNAGGLRARIAMKGGLKANPTAVSIDILSEESDQAGRRTPIVTGLRPDVVVRLNAGLYHLESRIGGANAIVRSEVSVEAGKLTEVTIEHDAAPVTFRLVMAPGGEAIAGTRWTILAENGNVVRESMGALPTHVLAPGRYTVVAQSQGRTFRRTFAVTGGEQFAVEVLASGLDGVPFTPNGPSGQDGAAAPSGRG